MKNIHLNNKKTASGTGMLMALLTVLALGMLVVFYLFLPTDNLVLHISLWVFLVLVLLVFNLGGFCYVDLSTENASLDIKYYNLFPFGRKYKRILLPLTKIETLKITSGLGTIGRKLVVVAKNNGQAAKYPKVGLAACDTAYIIELKALVDKLK